MRRATVQASWRRIALILPRVARTIRWAPQIASGPISFWIVYAGVHASRQTGEVPLPLAGVVLCVAAGFLLDDDAAETVGSAPTPLLVRRTIRVGLGIPLICMFWGVLAGYAAALTAGAAVEFAGMLALTLALAGIGAGILGEDRGGLFATPALFLLLGTSAFVSPRWRPFPIVPVGSTWFDLYGRWGVVLVGSVLVFLLASADPAARRPARRAIKAMVARRRRVASVVTPGHLA